MARGDAPTQRVFLEVLSASRRLFLEMWLTGMALTSSASQLTLRRYLVRCASCDLAGWEPVTAAALTVSAL